MPPNSANNFFGIKVSKAGLPVQNATDKQLVYKDDFSTKTYFDQTNSRMLEGLLPDGSYGLWVSPPGVDVATADPNTPGQLIFNSNQNIFKIVKKVPISMTYSHTVGSSEYHQVSLAHNLGFTPAFSAFHILDTTIVTYAGSNLIANRPNPALLYGAGGGFVVFLLVSEVTVDINNVYLTIQTGGNEPTASYTFSATVYLQQETFS